MEEEGAMKRSAGPAPPSPASSSRWMKVIAGLLVALVVGVFFNGFRPSTVAPAVHGVPPPVARAVPSNSVKDRFVNGEATRIVDGMEETEVYLKSDHFLHENHIIEKTLQTAAEEVYVYKLSPPRNVTKRARTVMLFHGAKYSVAAWQRTGTLKALAMAGYNVIATDLPGYGRSRGQVPALFRGDYVRALIRAVAVFRPYVVSPSISGTFTLPVLMKTPERIRGFIGVAPVGLSTFTPEEYSKVDFPTMFMYGANDPMHGEGAATVKAIPHTRVEVIPNAGHACYLDAPDAFHQLLLAFLEHAMSTEAQL